MLRTEYVDEGTRIRHYSDIGMYLRQVETGILYEDAVDYLPCRFTYAETDIPIEDWEEPEEPMVSSKNIANGEYFSAGNNLYLSTAAIAAGETIEDGVNCQSVELADALNELKEE